MRPMSLCFTIFGDYLRDLNIEIWVGSLISYLEPFGISSGLTRVTLSRMTQQGWVTSRRIGQKSYYRMSDKGKRRTLDGVTRVYDLEEERWDRNWQIISCDFVDIDKERREVITRELQWMGFGYLGQSTWISPHQRYGQLKLMIDEYELQDQAHVFTGIYEGIKSPYELVNKAWKIASIEEKYQSFLDTFSLKFQRVHQLGAEDSLTEVQAFVERASLVHEYRKFLFIDPHLPRELLPVDWVGEQARKLFKRYYDFVSPLAERFFYKHLETGSASDIEGS